MRAARKWKASLLLVGFALLTACAAEPEGDSSSYCVQRWDRDGDGVSRTDYSECSDGREVDPTNQFEDCDDTNPDVNLHATHYADEDGDGFGDPNGATAWVCPGESAPGYAPNGWDCAPDDADRSLTYFRDADGDGAGGTLDCGTVPDFDHGMLFQDCDDADPNVSNLAEELPLDGVDSDCDGEDLPSLECTAVESLEIPASASCDGIGLAFVAYVSCATICGPTNPSIMVANIGSMASPVSTLRIVRDAGEPADQDIPVLQPGEQTSLSLPEDGDLELSILLPNQAESCAPAEYLTETLTRTYTLPPSTQRTQCIK